MTRYAEGTLDGKPGNGAVLRVPFVVDVDGYPPKKTHDSDAGWDICAAGHEHLFSGSITLVSTGLSMNIPPGVYGQLLTRSSMASKGLIVVGGVIDAGYTGEIVVMLANFGPLKQYVNQGDKIAQLVFLPVPRVTWVQVETLEATERGNAGFGSSGV